MGCSTSSQTSAVDTTRPSAKPEESNGASTTGVANENGNIAEDSETIPDQTPAEASAADASGDGTSASPPAGEESQPSAESTPAEKPAEATAAESPVAEAPAADTPETTASSSEAAAPDQDPPHSLCNACNNAVSKTHRHDSEATVADSEPKAEEAPAPSE